jgi:hypothetical protein
MTVSILYTLAITPRGAQGAPLTFGELSRYLGEHCNTLAEKQRNNRHALRDEIYRDGGVQFMESVIDEVFDDVDTRAKRKKWIKHTRFNNPLKRVVNELATVYAEPAKRSVDGDENNETYAKILDAISMDEQMLQISRLLNLHRALLVRFRVRRLEDGTENPPREPLLEVASPANVRAVLHPNDPSFVVGWLIRNSYRSARPLADMPVWTLWTDHEYVQLRDDMGVIGESYVEHKLGVNPWVSVALSPTGPGFWPGEEGEDLVAAAVSTWLASVLLLKETKSATNLPVIQGDGTQMARGQVADSETPIELADGQSVTTINMSMDTSMFRDAADHILEHVAQNYGMSGALIRQQGVQSADARELMRVPLRELRLHQQIPLRKFERRLVDVMIAVLASDMPSLKFNPTGWTIRFGEAQTPLSASQAIDVFVKARQNGLTSTIEFLLDSRPGLTRDQAVSMLTQYVEDELLRNALMRPLQMISGSMGAKTPDGKPAQGNTAEVEPEVEDDKDDAAPEDSDDDLKSE